MAAVTVLARLALAAAFGIAGAAKIADRTGVRASLSEFGLPARLVAPVAALLPLCEVIVAGLLLSARGLHAGALAAAVLLAIFTTAIVAALVRGRRPGCRCFGQLQPAPIGWKTIARNGAFGACAMWVLVEPAPPTSVRLTPLLAVLNGLQLFLLFELLRRYGKARLRLDALEAESGASIGSPAPALEKIRKGLTAAAASPMLLLFTEPDCPPCRALLAEIPRWERAIAVRNVVVQREREIAEQYHVTATPSAVLVDAGGRIASRVAIGRDEIAALLQP